MYNVFELPHDFLNREYTPEETQRFDDAIDKAVGQHSQHVTEELDPSQTKKVSRWSTAYDVERAHKQVFGDSERIVLPYDESQDPKITSDNYKTVLHVRNLTNHPVSPHVQVIDALKRGDYHTDDYLSGLAYHVDTPNRKIKIRSALNKIGADENPTASTTKDGKYMTLGQVYDADPVRAASTKQKQIVITRNKYDVAGMSTNRGWTSCMDMVNGCNKHYLPNDIHNGTLTAYLTASGDDGIKHPIGRINLKRFVHGDTRESTYIPEKSSYGTIPHGFRKKVEDWAETNYPQKQGVYMKHPSLYNDDGHTFSIKHSDGASDHEDAGAHHFKQLDGSMDYYQRRMHDYASGDHDYDDVYHRIDSMSAEYAKGLHAKDYAKLIHHSLYVAGNDYKFDAGNLYSDSPTEHFIHEWAASNVDTAKHRDALKQFTPEESMTEFSKLHGELHKNSDDYDDGHPLVEAQRAIMQHAFSQDHESWDKVKDHMITHMMDNNKLYDDAVQSVPSTKHLVELTKNPRIIHRIVNGDYTDSVEGEFSDWGGKASVSHHIGKYADAKLADHMMSSAHTNHAAFVSGLNENQHGEHIQHQLIGHLYMDDGHHDGEIKTPVSISMRDPATGVKQTHVGHRDDYVEPMDDESFNHRFHAISHGTKFKSVADVLKSRVKSGDIPKSGVSKNKHGLSIMEAYIQMLTNQNAS